MILRGVAHVHSRYSFDGHHALDEIVGFLAGKGLDFALMSEHTKRLTDDAFAAFLRDCDALSDERFLVVPGLEYEATPDFVHVLGYGLRKLEPCSDAGAIARLIRGAGALGVLAHPTWRAAHSLVPSAALHLLDGWEVWNGKADGRWGPTAEGCDRLQDVRRRQPRILGIGGVDLHNLEAYAGITLHVEAEARTGAALIAGLRAGAFTVVGERLVFEPRQALTAPAAAVGTAAGVALRSVRRWAERLDRRMARVGLQAPPSVYRLARRLFR